MPKTRSFLFFKEFIKNHKTVGSITPSGRSLTKKMLEPINFNEAKTIVEFGPGTGAITGQLIEKLAPGAQLFSIDTNPAFVQALSKKFPQSNVQFIEGQAQEITTILSKMGVNSVDAFVSSLPLSLIDDEKFHSISNQMRELLTAKGKYIQYQYSLQHLKKLKKQWIIDKISIAILNIPPGFIYVCRHAE